MMEFYYSVKGPALFGDSIETARWGISATISQPFADAIAKQKRTDRVEDILEGDAKIVLEQAKFPGFKHFSRNGRIYHFFDNTCLVRGMCVPGNACDLALDESGLRGLEHFREKGQMPADLSYMQHNVDSFGQAVMLDVLFRNWTNHFSYVLMKEFKR